MAYSRPALLAVGDVVSDTHMNGLRSNWIEYETHGHTGSNDGAVIRTLDPVAAQAFVR